MEFRLPDIGEGISEAEVVKWLVKKGDRIKRDQDLVKIETAKAIVDLPSPVNGKISAIKAKKGDVVKTGGVLAVIETKEKVRERKEEKFGVVGKIPGAEDKNIFEIVREKEKKEKAGKIRKEAGKVPKIEKTYDFFGHIERKEIKGIRKAIIENLSRVKEYLLVTSMDEADVTGLWDVRKKAKEKSKAKLTFLPYIVKACVEALREHPHINSSIEEGEIILKKYYNIGIAVALEEKEGGGLMVPVVKGADQKSIAAIANEIDELAKKARKRKIDLQELKGAGFSITNYGSVGGNYATPLPNPPESAILGLGRIFERDSKKILPLSLTFDHRVADGAIAAMFLNRVKELLADRKWLDRLKY